jgi:hypothetical protein
MPQILGDLSLGGPGVLAVLLPQCLFQQPARGTTARGLLTRSGTSAPMILFRNGKEARRLSGARPAEAIIADMSSGARRPPPTPSRLSGSRSASSDVGG